MMREVLTRRFGRLVRESGENGGDGKWNKWPDLVLIDGGRGAGGGRARRRSTEVGVEDVIVVGVAKGIDREAGREHFYRRGQRALPARIRRARCSTTCSACATKPIASPSAAIASAAPRRSAPIRSTRSAASAQAARRALLAHFGSARGVAQASLADLEAVDGISKALARKIHDFFHGES